LAYRPMMLGQAQAYSLIIPISNLLIHYSIRPK
jgi:hypothetical protein